MKIAHAFFFLFITLLFFSCSNPSPAGKKTGSIPATEEESIPSSPDVESTPDAATLKFLPTDSNAFYAVFALSPHTQAIVLTGYPEPFAGQRMLPVDTLLWMLVNEKGFFRNGALDSRPLKGVVDSSGAFVLLDGSSMHDSLAGFFEGEFFVTCTKGIVKRPMKKVLFSANMCNSSFIAMTFESIDTAQFGHPLLASRKMPQAPYANAGISRSLRQWNDSAISLWRDHSDTLAPQLFARINDSLYVAAFDDFHWAWGETDRNCWFPARQAFVVRNGRVTSRWAEELDLFGVPCD